MSAATLTPPKPVRAARKSATKSGSLCVVEIGVHVTLALPLEQGLQLVRLLGGATPVKPDFSMPGKYCERLLIGETRLQIIPPEGLILGLPKPAPKESGVKP